MPVPALDHVPQCDIYSFLEHLQGQWLHHLPGQLVPMPEFFPALIMKGSHPPAIWYTIFENFSVTVVVLKPFHSLLGCLRIKSIIHTWPENLQCMEMFSSLFYYFWLLNFFVTGHYRRYLLCCSGHQGLKGEECLVQPSSWSTRIKFSPKSPHLQL